MEVAGGPLLATLAQDFCAASQCFVGRNCTQNILVIHLTKGQGRQLVLPKHTSKRFAETINSEKQDLGAEIRTLAEQLVSDFKPCLHAAHHVHQAPILLAQEDWQRMRRTRLRHSPALAGLERFGSAKGGS